MVTESSTNPATVDLRIFICYRREDSAAYAGRVRDALVERYGPAAVFIDIENIRPGSDFAESLDEAIEQCQYVLVLIGPAWLARRGILRRRRLDDPDDVVRREIETALLAGVVVIPLLVHGAAMPTRNELPYTMRGLATRQAIDLRDKGWMNDVRLLLAELAARQVEQVRPTVPRADRPVDVSHTAIAPRSRSSRWRRLRRPRVLAAGATAAGLVAASQLFVPTTTDNPIMASGNIALLREDGQPRLVFPIATGGIGYCTRTDDADWSKPWSGPNSDPHWPGISNATMFSSGFHGFEVLGANNGVLTFGYRDNGLPTGVKRWHDPVPALDDQTDTPIRGVSGRPGFFQYQLDTAIDPDFLALVPVNSGGLALYRRDGIGQLWHHMGDIATSSGRIDSVTLAYSPTDGLDAVLRQGSALYETTRGGGGGLPSEIVAGWSEPRPLSLSGGVQIAASGDPALIHVDIAGDAHYDTLLLAVPVERGLALLSRVGRASAVWDTEPLPGVEKPDAVALIDGYQDGGPNLDIVYRRGDALYSLWRAGRAPWQGPTRVHC